VYPRAVAPAHSVGVKDRSPVKKYPMTAELRRRDQIVDIGSNGVFLITIGVSARIDSAVTSAVLAMDIPLQ
jgi:hypothetical protein